MAYRTFTIPIPQATRHLATATISRLLGMLAKDADCDPCRETAQHPDRFAREIRFRACIDNAEALIESARRCIDILTDDPPAADPSLVGLLRDLADRIERGTE